MAQTKKRAGVGAKVVVKTRLLHPTLLVKAQVIGVDVPFQHETINLHIARKEEKRVRRKQQMCYVLHHPDYTNDDGTAIDLYSVCRNCRIEEEGAPEDLFNNPIERVVETEDEDSEDELPADIIALRPGDDYSAVLREGITIDDDNQPAPENVVQTPHDTDNMFDEWGFKGFCERRKEQLGKFDAKFENYNGQYDPQSLFEHLFPIKWVKEVLIVETSRQLNDNPLTYGEFLRFYGLWLTMSTHEGCHRRDWWSTTAVSMYSGAPFRFHDYMTRSRFEDILQALRYTTQQPTNDDRFYEVREMVDCWNKNMAKNFRPSYINCLDESMSPWSNVYRCPGYMYVPRKPHPFGNEYHSVACGQSGLMWGVEMVEGKDQPKNSTKDYEDRGGKTVGLLLRLTKPFWYSGICLVLDSGFCVLKALVELRRVGIYAAAVIKKRRYWPKYILGQEIADHFIGKQVGSFDVQHGKLDGINFGVFAMKEPDYVMSLMATYGTDEAVQESAAVRTTINDDGESRLHFFKYTELFHNHFKFRNAVDLHNQLRHQPISVEDTWATMRWSNRVFAFLLAITEVNVKMAMEHFGRSEKRPMLTTRRLIAEALINNHNIEQERTGRTIMNLRPVLVRHTLMTVDQFRRWNGRKFVKSKTRFPQRRCGGCKKKIRTYCACSPNKGICQACHCHHILELQETVHHCD
jgi:hypothetical protein